MIKVSPLRPAKKMFSTFLFALKAFLDEETLPLSIDFLKQKERLKTNRKSCRKQNKKLASLERGGSQLPVQELSGFDSHVAEWNIDYNGNICKVPEKYEFPSTAVPRKFQRSGFRLGIKTFRNN